MSQKIVPVVLAGGQGTRLWPMSRAARPKQFLNLTGPRSLFQQTLDRVADASLYAPAIIVTNAEYRFIVAEQAAEVGAPLAGILLEPQARNTAVAIASAAVYATQHFGPASVLFVLPSDHAVEPTPGYLEAVRRACDAAASGELVTFGITPTRPETGYGYIKSGTPIGAGVHRVAHFAEKPDVDRAGQMLAEGGYYWNSGMFMVAADTFLSECAVLAPETLRAAQAGVDAAKSDLDFVRLDSEAFSSAPSISVDYAIFEHTRRAAVVPVSFPWSDLGSWDAVWSVSQKNEDGNAASGSATFRNVHNSMVSTTQAHVVVDGLDDVAVIASEDAIYVGQLSNAQGVGGIVKMLRQQPGTVGITEIHRTAYRPWGGYASVLSGERFQVKRLFVRPGKRLSLQKHHHRSEHWVVVRGTAEVTVDGKVTMLTENQSIYLPLGCEHRLANPGKIELELIEVQTGSYLGEDDIIRISDEFGRA